jgi:hypothetical protein
MPLCRYRRRLGKKMKKNSRTYRRARYGRFLQEHNKWSLRASSTGELIFDVKVPKKICYQTNLVWGTTDVRFSTLRNRLGSYGAAWIVMTALRYAKRTI